MNGARAIGWFACGTACALTLWSCNIVGPAAWLVAGPAQAEAEYVLPDRPTVVFVDDRRNVIPSQGRALRQRIAEKISQEIMVNELVTTTISPRDAMAVASKSDRYGELLAIDAIGKGVGAEQIIFVEMEGFTPTPDGVTPRPIAFCHVRVIDVPQRTRVYPAEGEQNSAASRPVQASLSEIDPALLHSPSSRLVVYQDLADELGSEIAKLFYKHEIKEIGAGLDGQ